MLKVLPDDSSTRRSGVTGFPYDPRCRRLPADYTGEPIDIEKAIWAVDQADHFIRKLVVVIGAAELDRE
jgi:hypothetical protein